MLDFCMNTFLKICETKLNKQLSLTHSGELLKEYLVMMQNDEKQ